MRQFLELSFYVIHARLRSSRLPVIDDISALWRHADIRVGQQYMRYKHLRVMITGNGAHPRQCDLRSR